MAENDKPAEGGGDSGAAPDAAERLIARFGGLRPMAGKLGIAVSTVQGWKNRGHIPAARTDEIRKAAAEHDIALDEAELAAATAEQPSGEPAGAPREAGEPEPLAEPVEAEPVEAEHVEGPRPWGSGPDEDAGLPRDAVEGEPEPEPERPPPRRPAPAPGASRGGAWAGGLVLGAVLVVGGAAAAVLTQPYWQPYLDRALPGVEQRVEQRLDSELAPLRDRLQSLESAPAPAADTTELQDQLSALQERVSSLAGQLEQGAAAAGDEAAGGEALEALRQRVSELESSAGSTAGGLSAEAADELRRQVSRVEEMLAASGADPQALEGFRTEVAKLSARFEDLEGTIEQLRQGLARIEVVQSELADVKSRLTDLSDRVGQSGQQAEQARAELDRRVEANAQALQQASDARNQGALLALALGQLREALRFSEPYDQELQGVEAVAAGGELSSLLEPLKAEAETGVPNLTALRRQFSELAPEIVGATYGSGEQGWLREVMDRVPELVTVRPVGQATGDSVGAKVARAERALTAGDLPAAAAEVESLEGEAAEVAAPWLEKAHARLAVDDALADLTRRAIAQLSGGSAAPAQPSGTGG